MATLCKTSKTWWLLLVIGITALATNAQTAYFDSEDFWKKFSLQKSVNIQNSVSADTIAIIASNRSYNDTSIRFLPDEYKGGIRYFLVYSKNGKWNVAPVRDLASAISALPDKNKDWVVYTEGMGKLFTTGVDRAMRMNAAYDVNVIYLDYPSIKAKWRRTRNYYFSKHYASIAYKDFAPVLDTIMQLKEKGQMGNKSLNLFFHSMGNIVLRKMVQQDRITPMNQVKWVDNLILNAPCVPQRKHAKWLEKIQFAKRSFVLYNPNDFTLGGAYLMSKQNQLGMKVKKPISKEVTYINFESLVGKKHSNFLNLHGYPPQPAAAIRLYNTLFHGGETKLKDTLYYRPSSYRGIGYDLLP